MRGQMHPIEPHLPALNRYAKSLVKGKPHLDYQDIAQEAVLACLIANPKELTQGYVLSAARSRALNIFKRPIDDSVDADYLDTVTAPYDTEAMYEDELLYNWAEKVLRLEHKLKIDNRRDRSEYYRTEAYKARKRKQVKEQYWKNKNGKQKAAA